MAACSHRMNGPSIIYRVWALACLIDASRSPPRGRAVFQFQWGTLWSVAVMPLTVIGGCGVPRDTTLEAYPSLQLPFVGNSMASPSFGGYRAPASQRSGSATPARASSQRPLAPEVSPQMFGSVRVPRKSASMTFPFHFEADSLPDAHLKGVGLAEISSRRFTLVA